MQFDVQKCKNVTTNIIPARKTLSTVAESWNFVFKLWLAKTFVILFNVYTLYCVMF